MVISHTFLFAQNEAEAKKILDEVSDTMQEYDHFYIKFDYSLVNKEAGVEQNNNGELSIQGEKYHVNFFGTTQIFDGNKTYTIIPENEEVNISDASDESEGTLTPQKFYTFYKKGYIYSLGKKKKIKGKDIQFVKLIPIDSNSDIAEVSIGVDPKTKHIYTIIEKGKNGTLTILTVKKFKTDKKISNDLFQFDRKKYEDLGYMIND
jgi:hypothetical protein